ncbi:hypothetical protein PILCRDRAFT_17176, partial [Piloderma croceum F 1598]
LSKLPFDIIVINRSEGFLSPEYFLSPPTTAQRQISASSESDDDGDLYGDLAADLSGDDVGRGDSHMSSLFTSSLDLSPPSRSGPGSSLLPQMSTLHREKIYVASNSHSVDRDEPEDVTQGANPSPLPAGNRRQSGPFSSLKLSPPPRQLNPNEASSSVSTARARHKQQSRRHGDRDEILNFLNTPQDSNLSLTRPTLNRRR